MIISTAWSEVDFASTVQGAAKKTTPYKKISLFSE